MRKKLSKRLCEGVKPDPEKRIVIKDSLVDGLQLRVSPAGKKTFMLYYRNTSGEQRMPVVGVFPKTTVDAARRKARAWLTAVDAGRDPSIEKQEARKGLTLTEAVERFLGFLEGKRKRNTIRAYGWSLRAHAGPLGSRRVSAITRADMAWLHASVTAKSGPAAANHLILTLSSMFNYCEQVGERPEFSNPCRRISRNRQRGRERFLSAEEFGRLAAALDKAEAEMPMIVAAIRLLVLTGCRKSEILTLRWSYIDAENRRIRLPDAKSGARTVHLPHEALEILKMIEAMREPGDLVFPGKSPGKSLSCLQAPWVKIRAAAKLEDVHIHDLRHSWASVAAALGMSLPIIGKSLGHLQQNTVQRYVHLTLDPVALAVDLVGAEITRAMTGGARIIPVAVSGQAVEEVVLDTAGAE